MKIWLKKHQPKVMLLDCLPCHFSSSLKNL